MADPNYNTNENNIGEPKQTCPLIHASLEVIKIKFDTKYDVCSDKVKGNNDYKNFYILKDGGYYHWLKKRIDKEDLKKPNPIPITFSSKDKLKFTATFKVNSTDDFPKIPNITVVTSDMYADELYTCTKFSYDFDAQVGKAGGEFDLTFESKNIPDGFIQFSPYFTLTFEYSDGAGNSGIAGTCAFDLFLTWETPKYRLFEVSNLTMQLKCNENGNKRNILESLLYIGCKQADRLGKQKVEREENEEHILDNIFNEFTNCRVNRRRNQLANYMGYWRGHSKALSSQEFSDLRSLRFLLHDYTKNALTGVLYVKLDSKKGEAFKDDKHTKLFVDPVTANFSPIPGKKYLYETVNNNMEGCFRVTVFNSQNKIVKRVKMVKETVL